MSKYKTIFFILNFNFVLNKSQINSNEDMFDHKIVDIAGEKFGVDCFVIISDYREKDMHSFIKNQHKMAQIVTKTNISAVFRSFESKSHCGYFMIIRKLKSVKIIVKEIYETAPNVFQKFPWFILPKESLTGTPQLGLKLKFDTNINIFQFLDDRCDVYELYGLQDDQIIFNMIGSLQDGHLHIQSIDKLERRKDLQGITLR